MDDFSFDGLPLHPLLVHLIVILVPLTALALVLSVLWPAARRRIGIVAPLAALLLVVAVPLTQAAGSALADQLGSTPAIEEHERLGDMLEPWTVALLFASSAVWVWFRVGAARMRARSVTGARVVHAVLAVVSIAIAAGVTVLVVLIGVAGARAVWG